jgi:hypothetical protein
LDWKFRPGYKGFFSRDTGWVTWEAEWPSGEPHHDEVREEHFPDADWPSVEASISPRKPTGLRRMASEKWAVNIYTSLPIWSEDMREAVETVAVVTIDSQLFLDTVDEHYEGTVRSYLDEWDGRNSGELNESEVVIWPENTEGAAVFYFELGHGNYLYDEGNGYTDPLTHEIWVMLDGQLERHPQVDMDRLLGDYEAYYEDEFEVEPLGDRNNLTPKEQDMFTAY